MLIFYVNNFLIVYQSKDQVYFDEFEKKLLDWYDFQALGEAEHFLGIRIIWDRPNQKLWLIQDSYIDKIAKKYNIYINKALKTLIPLKELEQYIGNAIV